jgi:hypothetical protein
MRNRESGGSRNIVNVLHARAAAQELVELRTKGLAHRQSVSNAD